MAEFPALAAVCGVHPDPLADEAQLESKDTGGQPTIQCIHELAAFRTAHFRTGQPRVGDRGFPDPAGVPCRHQLPELTEIEGNPPALAAAPDHAGLLFGGQQPIPAAWAFEVHATPWPHPET